MESSGLMCLTKIHEASLSSRKLRNSSLLWILEWSVLNGSMCTEWKLFVGQEARNTFRPSSEFLEQNNYLCYSADTKEFVFCIWRKWQSRTWMNFLFFTKMADNMGMANNIFTELWIASNSPLTTTIDTPTSRCPF